jgi:hypothetical protein
MIASEAARTMLIARRGDALAPRGLTCRDGRQRSASFREAVICDTGR